MSCHRYGPVHNLSEIRKKEEHLNKQFIYEAEKLSPLQVLKQWKGKLSWLKSKRKKEYSQQSQFVHIAAKGTNRSPARAAPTRENHQDSPPANSALKTSITTVTKTRDSPRKQKYKQVARPLRNSITKTRSKSPIYQRRNETSPIIHPRIIVLITTHPNRHQHYQETIKHHIYLKTHSTQSPKDSP